MEMQLKWNHSFLWVLFESAAISQPTRLIYTDFYYSIHEERMHFAMWYVIKRMLPTQQLLTEMNSTKY